MIELRFPGITQEQFADAFAVLEECKANPTLGFRYPFLSPGGSYGNCWWERDSSLTLNGYCWVDQSFCERALENFGFVQKKNGRIPLWGYDRVENADEESRWAPWKENDQKHEIRYYDEELSAIPVLFDSAEKILRRTTDQAYIRKIYGMLARYFAWWISPVKRDPTTGLICAIFEESDPCCYAEQLTYAPVDLNVAVAVGADVLAGIADYLGESSDAAYYRAGFGELKESINRWLYDDETGGYYTRQVRENRLMTERPYNSTFDVFRRGIVPAERVPRLLELLRDPRKYGYGNAVGLATVPFDSPEFRETRGTYQGWLSWCGNVWTFRNRIIARGLKESGCREEAARVACQTIRTFNGKYAEFVTPSDGEGQGVLRYGWTAAEYIELLIEDLCGIDWCAWTDRVTVKPNLPPEIANEPISVSGLSLGNGRTLDVSIEGSRVETRIKKPE